MTRWLTASEIIELGLPSLPADKGALSRVIAREAWRATPFAREGERGWEYHSSLLPLEAQAALLQQALAEAPAPRHDAGWEEFERLPENAKAEARRRLGIVDQVNALVSGGAKAGDAVALVARRADVSGSTLWGWLGLIKGVPNADRLAALAPRRKGRTVTADCDPRAWDFFTADYLRPERPSITACYRRLVETAAVEGWSPIPSSKTLQRRLENTFPAAAIVLARDGREAAARV